MKIGRARAARRAAGRRARPAAAARSAGPASRIVCLARLIRCAIVASGTRNARAISAVSARRPRAGSARAATARDSAGWQHRNSSVERVVGRGGDGAASRRRVERRDRLLAPRRALSLRHSSTSRRDATVISHAARIVRHARRRPLHARPRAAPPARRPRTRRTGRAGARARRGPAARARAAGPRSASSSIGRRGASVDLGRAVRRPGAPRPDPEYFTIRLAISTMRASSATSSDPVADERLLRLGERTVGDDDLAVGEPDHLGLRAVDQPLRVDELAGASSSSLSARMKRDHLLDPLRRLGPRTSPRPSRTS